MQVHVFEDDGSVGGVGDVAVEDGEIGAVLSHEEGGPLGVRALEPEQYLLSVRALGADIS